MTATKFLDDLLEQRRISKRQILEAGEIRLPTDERRAYQLDMYCKSSSMGSKQTPLYRG